MARKAVRLESGIILVAPPALVDPNFRKSVVLLCEHTTAGSFGLILNHRVTVAMAELMADLSSYTEPVRIGGPVQLDTLHFLHTYGSEVEGAVQIVNGVYWGGEIEELQRLFDEKRPTRDELRFFLGYAGWGEGQLEAELEAGGWILLPATLDLVFPKDPEKLWREAMIRLGGEYSLLANYPNDPGMN